MDEFKDLLKQYFSDESCFLAAREFGPVESIGHCFQTEDSWQVVCDYAGDNRVEARVNCGELMGWMWARVKPMINHAA
jgi:hypothetical protein